MFGYQRVRLVILIQLEHVLFPVDAGESEGRDARGGMIERADDLEFFVEVVPLDRIARVEIRIEIVNARQLRKHLALEEVPAPEQLLDAHRFRQRVQVAAVLRARDEVLKPLLLVPLIKLLRR